MKRTAYTLKRVGKIVNSPVMPLLVEAWDRLLVAGQTSGIPIAWDHSAVYFEYKGAPVAVMSYTYTDWNSQVWIHLGYVQPAHRRRGLYRDLYLEVRKFAIEKGAVTLSGGVDRKNKIMQRVAESQGRHCQYSVYEENLPPAVEKAAA